MKFQCFSIFLIFALICCKEKTKERAQAYQPIVIQNIEVNKKELTLDQLKGVWYYNNQPFNGYSMKFHSNGNVEERLGFHLGKREGIAQRWSRNGVLLVKSFYKQNRLSGSYKSWWENGILGSEATYINGKLNSVEKKWYSTGEVSKERILVDGREEGIQKAWLKNGKLYVNYEAKNGRIFGMKRANSCYQLKDEVVIRSK